MSVYSFAHSPCWIESSIHFVHVKCISEARAKWGNEMSFQNISEHRWIAKQTLEYVSQAAIQTPFGSFLRQTAHILLSRPLSLSFCLFFFIQHKHKTSEILCATQRRNWVLCIIECVLRGCQGIKGRIGVMHYDTQRNDNKGRIAQPVENGMKWNVNVSW